MLKFSCQKHSKKEAMLRDNQENEEAFCCNNAVVNFSSPVIELVFLL